MNTRPKAFSEGGWGEKDDCDGEKKGGSQRHGHFSSGLQQNFETKAGITR